MARKFKSKTCKMSGCKNIFMPFRSTHFYCCEACQKAGRKIFGVLAPQDKAKNRIWREKLEWYSSGRFQKASPEKAAQMINRELARIYGPR